MARHDIAQLKDRLPLADLIGDVVQLKKHGSEFKGLCPFHKEKTPSFGVFEKQGREGYYCAGCGAGGDHIQFLQDYYQLDFPEAVDRLAELAGGGSLAANDNAAKRQSKRIEKPVQEWKAAVAPADEPPPSSLWVNREGDWVEVPVVAAWPYRDGEGNLHSYTCRVEFDKPDGSRGKDVIPVLWKVNTKTGEEKWKQGALPQPRLLYGTELLAASPSANVILVEGEKAADAARRLLAGTPFLVLTWAGGCKAVGKADWSLLAGRKVVGWPDCDSQAYADNHAQAGQLKPYHEQPGMAAMLAIATELEKHGAAMRIVAVEQPGGEWPNGYDLADLEIDGWTQEQVLGYLKERMHTPAEIVAMAAPAQQDEPPYANDNEPPAYDYPPEYDGGDGEPIPYEAGPDVPFRMLGVDRGTCFYLPSDVPQILELSASAHTKLNLLLLAPLHWWERWYPSERKGQETVNWSMAANALLQQSKRVGVFSHDQVRGRGAWWDDGRAAVHMGDSVVIDRQVYGLVDVPSRFIYEARPRWNVNTDNPLTTSEAVKLAEICAMPNWEKSISGKLLAGFCFLAPIGGALSYRPSVWITGKSGTGKSTVLEKLIWRMVESVCMYAASNTSEAGIRQGLETDAIPVVFDEFESESKRQSDQVQEVLKLLTLSATDNGAAIYKGSSSGKASAFRVRSMFSFSSIGVNIGQHAARTRVSVLSLVRDRDEAQGLLKFNRMIDMIEETMTDEWVQRMHARAISMIPVVRHNARVFAEAGAVVLGMRRLGDQIGTLLAGCYALYSSNKISPEKAREWLESQDWDDERAINEQADESMCIAHIFGRICRLSTSAGNIERSVGELVQKVAGTGHDHAITKDEADSTLKRMGLRVSDGKLMVANNHPELKRMLDNTQWGNSWALTIGRIEGAEKSDKPQKFAGVTSRYVSVPLDKII